MIVLLLMFVLIVTIYCLATFDNAKDPSEENGLDVFKLIFGILGLSLFFLFFDSMC